MKIPQHVAISMFAFYFGILFIPAIFARDRIIDKSLEKEFIGTLERFTGKGAKVESRHPEHHGMFSVTRGQKLFSPFVLRTQGARAHFRLRDGTYCEGGEKSSIEIEKANVTTSKEVVIRFNYGALRVTSPYVSVLQPVLVKSTNVVVFLEEPADFFMIQAAGARDMQVAVIHGKVTLQSVITNERIDVIQGMNVFVRVSGAIEPSGEVDDALVQSLKGKTRT